MNFDDNLEIFAEFDEEHEAMATASPTSTSLNRLGPNSGDICAVTALIGRRSRDGYLRIKDNQALEFMDERFQEVIQSWPISEIAQFHRDKKKLILTIIGGTKNHEFLSDNKNSLKELVNKLEGLSNKGIQHSIVSNTNATGLGPSNAALDSRPEKPDVLAKKSLDKLPKPKKLSKKRNFNSGSSLKISSPLVETAVKLTGSGEFPGSMSFGHPVKARAIYDFEPSNEEEIAVTEGEVLIILDKSDPDWWSASRIGDHDKVGLVPATYVELEGKQSLADLHATSQSLFSSGLDLNSSKLQMPKEVDNFLSGRAAPEGVSKDPADTKSADLGINNYGTSSFKNSTESIPPKLPSRPESEESSDQKVAPDLPPRNHVMKPPPLLKRPHLEPCADDPSPSNIASPEKKSSFAVNGAVSVLPTQPVIPKNNPEAQTAASGLINQKTEYTGISRGLSNKTDNTRGIGYNDSRETEKKVYDMRMWQDSRGKYKVEARFSVLSGDCVELIKEDGKKVRPKLEKLCEKDREYVAKITGTEMVKVPENQAKTDRGSPKKRRLSYKGFDWYEFFKDCGIDDENSKIYAEKFVAEEIEGSSIANFNDSRLNRLGLREGHIMKVMEKSKKPIKKPTEMPLNFLSNLEKDSNSEKIKAMEAESLMKNQQKIENLIRKKSLDASKEEQIRKDEELAKRLHEIELKQSRNPALRSEKRSSKSSVVDKVPPTLPQRKDNIEIGGVDQLGHLTIGSHIPSTNRSRRNKNVKSKEVDPSVLFELAKTLDNPNQPDSKMKSDRNSQELRSTNDNNNSKNASVSSSQHASRSNSVSRNVALSNVQADSVFESLKGANLNNSSHQNRGQSSNSVQIQHYLENGLPQASYNPKKLSNQPNMYAMQNKHQLRGGADQSNRASPHNYLGQIYSHQSNPMQIGPNGQQIPTNNSMPQSQVNPNQMLMSSFPVSQPTPSTNAPYMQPPLQPGIPAQNLNNIVPPYHPSPNYYDPRHPTYQNQYPNTGQPGYPPNGFINQGSADKYDALRAGHMGPSVFDRAGNSTSTQSNQRKI